MNLDQLREGAIAAVLTQEETVLAWTVGWGRDKENEGKRDRISYDQSKLMPDNVLAGSHAAAAEIGTCKAILATLVAGARVWHRSEHGVMSQLPDAEWNGVGLEIKWRRSSNFMPIDWKDVEANRMVLWSEAYLEGCECDGCYRPGYGPRASSRVRVLGGGWAVELWERGEIYNGDLMRRRVPLERIQSIAACVQIMNP